MATEKESQPCASCSSWEADGPDWRRVTPAGVIDIGNTTALRGVSPDDGGLVVRMMVAVGVVIALGVAALYVSKRVLPRMAHPEGREIHVVETSYLGPRKALHLVEVGGQRWLIASTNDNVSMLAPVGDPWLDDPRQQADPAAES